MPFRSSRRVSRKSARRSSRRRSRTIRGGGKPTFAAKLGAFLLEGSKGQIQFSDRGGFSSKVPEVFGALPYLHMNISEAAFRKGLNESNKQRTGSLSKVCKAKKLERKLSKVNFSCVKQPQQGVKALDNGLVDSINNRWNIRRNGQKCVREVLKYQRYQVDKGIIPPSSIAWGVGL
jgi:hypothetical protein